MKHLSLITATLCDMSAVKSIGKYISGLVSLLLFAACLSTTAQAAQIVHYDGKPVTIELSAGIERSINFGTHVQVGVTKGQQQRNLFRSQTAQGYVHIRANKAFNKERIQVKRADTGAIILIDLTAREGGSFTEEVQVMTGEQNKATNPFASSTDNSLSLPMANSSITPVTLTRYAASQLYAPRRIHQPIPGISKTPIGVKGEIKVFKGINRAFVDAYPSFAIKGGGYYLAVIHLVNNSANDITLDYLDINLPFSHATFQHHSLKPSGQSGDDTILYLVSDKPLTQVLVPWDFYAPQAQLIADEGCNKMQSNMLVKIIAGAAVLLIISLLVIGRGEEKSQAVASEPIDLQGSPTLDSLQAIETTLPEFDTSERLLDERTLSDEFGANLDDDKAVMRQLLAEFKEIRRQNDTLATENRALSTRVKQMLNMEDSIRKRVDGELDLVTRQTQQNNTKLENSLTESNNILDGLRVAYDDLNANRSASQPTASGYSINGIDTDNLGYTDTGEPVDTGEVIWQTPLDAKQEQDGSMAFPDISLSGIDFTQPIDVLTEPLGQDEKLSKEARSIKAYTIPNNATLFGSVGMTALLGRIPLDGVVESAYPFKVLIGEDNLSSNGIHIPDLVGIKMSGFAAGDWLLSCVSGEILSMTFTFADGTIVSYPEKDEELEKPLGWFSDDNGVPCVTGTKLTNAPQYLSQRIGLGAIGAYADAKVQSEFTNSTNGLGGASSVLTGDPLAVARNSAISGSVSEVSNWLEERQNRAFDAIYVEPGTDLIVHITQEIWVDYDPEGRKVIHHESINQTPTRTLD